MRKHYIDNLRWLDILLLIPYHAAQAWNVWGEPNYIIFNGNKFISSIIVFFSPYFMPLLFTLAGMSTKFALNKRTYRQYVTERAKRLLAPLIFGTLTFMPIMTFIADKFNYDYNGGFLEHYSVFFTKFTDLTGADGGFSFGHFWFLLYLFVISLFAVGIIDIQKKLIPKIKIELPFWFVCILGLPLPILSDWLSVGGKSLVEYTYIFLIGYYVFSNDEIVDKLKKYKTIFIITGLIASVLNVYLFIWSETTHTLLNTITKFTAEWFMLLALIGVGKKYLDFNGKVSSYMSKMSFPFFSFHFIWVVLLQFLVSDVLQNNIILLYAIPVILSYGLTFICCEIFIRVPLLSFFIGAKSIKKKM